MTDLEDLMQRARAAFEALTPDQQEHHRHEQRIDFAAGNVALSWPEPAPGEESNIDKARRLVSETAGPCPCGDCVAKRNDEDTLRAACAAAGGQMEDETASQLAGYAAYARMVQRVLPAADDAPRIERRTTKPQQSRPIKRRIPGTP